MSSFKGMVRALSPLAAMAFDATIVALPTPADAAPLSIAAATALVAGLGFGAWAKPPTELSKPVVRGEVQPVYADDPNLARYKEVVAEQGVTGAPPRAEDLREARAHCTLPVILGSGATADNVAEFYEHADAFVVGSYFKAGGRWSGEVERGRVERFMGRVFALRGREDVGG